MQDKARGCLIGQFVGDALGSQVEFFSAQRIRYHYPHGLREISASLTWDTLPGQITDDSEMALALARTLIKTKNTTGRPRTQPIRIGCTPIPLTAAIPSAPPCWGSQTRTARPMAP